MGSGAEGFLVGEVDFTPLCGCPVLVCKGEVKASLDVLLIEKRLSDGKMVGSTQGQNGTTDSVDTGRAGQSGVDTVGDFSQGSGAGITILTDEFHQLLKLGGGGDEAWSPRYMAIFG